MGQRYSWGKKSFCFVSSIPLLISVSIGTVLGAESEARLSRLKLPCSDGTGTKGLEEAARSLSSSDPARIPLSTCAGLFGSCAAGVDKDGRAYNGDPKQLDKNGFPVTPGVKAQIKDGLVRQVVRSRINNLYNGVNALANLDNPMLLKRSQQWRGGESNTSYACNVFIDEAFSPSWGTVTLPNSADENTTAMDKANNKSIFSFLDSSAKRSFTAKGVLNGGSSKTCGNWPTHKIEFDKESKTCAKLKKGQKKVSDEDDANIKTVAWDDGSYAEPGTENCHTHYTANYRDASAISALQAGALVQATWMKLDEVLNEIENGELRVDHTLCQQYAADLMTNIKNAAVNMSNAEACDRDIKQIMNNCKKTYGGEVLQSDCYLAALSTTLQSSGYIQVAECEVYKRANDLYSGLFIDQQGKTYANQLKNWATLACMREADLNVDDEETAKANVESKLKTCFPQAYVIALHSYLSNNSVSSNEQRKLSTVTVQNSYNGGVLNPEGRPYIKINNSVMTDSTPSTLPSPGPIHSFFDLNQLFHQKLDKIFKKVGPFANAEKNDDFFLGIPFVSLGLVLRRKKSKDKLASKKNRAITSKTRALMVVFLFVLTFASGCDDPPEYSVFTFVQYSCIGLNGTLLTGRQAEKCCKYDDSAKGLKGTAQAGDGSQSGDGDTNCPGDPDEIFDDLSVKTAVAQDTISSLIGNIQGNMSTNNPVAAGSSTGLKATQYNPFDTAAPILSTAGGESAATAGGEVARRDQNKGATAGTGANGNGTDGGKGRGFGGGGGGGLLGSAMEAMSGMLGAQSPSGTAGQVAGTGSDSAAGGGAYTSGGAGGNGGGAGRPNGDVDPSNIEWGLGQGAKLTASVGEGAETTDPADYFTRMGANENIFKKVEEKYRQKAPNFAEKK